MNDPLRLGTRGSQLALWQAHWTRQALADDGIGVEIVEIRTTGDRIQSVPLAEVGGKGLFTKELDEALIDGRIDMAVHSLKDLPFALPVGIRLDAVGEREDPRDAFLSKGPKLEELPEGARIGTSSLRRQAQLRARFPGIQVEMLRGNVDTRLRRLEDGDFDGIVLAAAGLKRLGHGDRITQILETGQMLPAVGQGALAFVCREDDPVASAALARLNHADTRAAITAERALMASLEGSCQVPLAGHATIDGDRLRLEGLIASLDGTRVVSDVGEGPRSDAVTIGSRLGSRLRASGGDDILAVFHG